VEIHLHLLDNIFQPHDVIARIIQGNKQPVRQNIEEMTTSADFWNSYLTKKKAQDVMQYILSIP
jgi:hypothetical protein